MNKTKIVNQVIHPLLRHQCEKNTVPQGTILFGENPPHLLNEMIAIGASLTQQSATSLPEPSDTIQEIHEDLLVLHPIKTIKIDLIKSLVKRIQYGPANHPASVILVHGIHTLTNSAKNALLKPLEEPPENTYFIFSASTKASIPITLKSRTQLFYIPTPPHQYRALLSTQRESISQKLNYVSPVEFLRYSPFKKAIYIQSLPYDHFTVAELIMVWQKELHLQWPQLQKKDMLFLKKIIEIISNLTYNFNLKLQLLAASFQIEEENLQ
jgi:hypothetical protein